MSSPRRKTTSAAVGDPGRKAFLNRKQLQRGDAGEDESKEPPDTTENEANEQGLDPAASRTRNPDKIREIAPVAGEKVGPQPGARNGATRKSPKLAAGVEPGDAAAVAAAHRRKLATHKRDGQTLKR